MLATEEAEVVSPEIRETNLQLVHRSTYQFLHLVLRELLNVFEHFIFLSHVKSGLTCIISYRYLDFSVVQKDTQRH